MDKIIASLKKAVDDLEEITTKDTERDYIYLMWERGYGYRDPMCFSSLKKAEQHVESIANYTNGEFEKEEFSDRYTIYYNDENHISQVDYEVYKFILNP
jgi:hypothetical protein